LKRRVRLRVALGQGAVVDQAEAATVLLDVARTSAASHGHGLTRNTAFLHRIFHEDKSRLVHGLNVLDVPPLRPTRRLAEHGLAARLRLLSGDSPLRQYRTMAKMRVYDLDQYRDHAAYGPFYADSGHVDWLMAEALVKVMRCNISDVYGPDFDGVEVENSPVPPPPDGYEVTAPWPARPLADPQSGDWAGIGA
jgi:hypothetical protein